MTVEYPWIEGEAYEVALVTATGGTVNASIEVAAETPEADLGFFGLMALVGLYVGVIPVAIGMLWLPWIRRSTRATCSSCWRSRSGCSPSSASTRCSRAPSSPAQGSQAFGGAALVYLGAAVAYLALVGVDGRLRRTKEREKGDGARPVAARLPGGARHRPAQPRRGPGDRVRLRDRLAGAGRHADRGVRPAQHHRGAGDRRARGEGRGGRQRATCAASSGLGLLAGLPAVLGAWVGASAFNPSLAAFMFGLGAGAIAQVIVQIAPSIRDSAGRLLHPLAVGGVVSGLVLMYATGLLISL